MADIIVRCKKCNTELATPQELIGKEVSCYNCQTLQVIQAPVQEKAEIPVLHPPKTAEPPEVAAPAEQVDAPAFSPMLEISPDNEIEMPQASSPVKTETGPIKNLNDIENPHDKTNTEAPPPPELPTLNLKTEVKEDQDGVPMLSLKKPTEPKTEPVPPPAPKPAPPVPEEVTFRCVGCKSILVAPGEHIGYNVRCDHCDTKMPVPETSNVSITEEKEPEQSEQQRTPDETKIPLPPTPELSPSIPQAPIAKDEDEDEDATTNIQIPIPTLRPSPNKNEISLPKAPIALDDNDDDKSIPKLRPPTHLR